MWMIYKKAKRVIVWLDTANVGSLSPREIFRILKDLAEGGLYLKKMDDEVTTVIDELSNHRWFSRRWELQEVHQGDIVTVRLGKEECDWNMVSEGVRAAQKIVSGAERLQYGIFRTVWILKHSMDDWLALLRNLTHAECEDKSDILYASYGLTREALAPNMPRPNYQRPWQETYEAFARHFIEHGQWVEILGHCFAFGTLRDGQAERPSWVPNWSNKTTRDLRHWEQKLESSPVFEILPGPALVISESLSAHGKDVYATKPRYWNTTTDTFQYSRNLPIHDKSTRFAVPVTGALSHTASDTREKSGCSPWNGLIRSRKSPE